MSKAKSILAALGGRENLSEIESCITRIRAELKDVSVVDEDAIRAAGAFGVVRQGNLIQIIVGPEADSIVEEIEA